MLLIAAAFLPSCSTSEEMAGAVPARTAVLSIEDLVETILGRQTAHDVVEKLPKQEGGALASSLRRSLADVLKNAPRLHVRAQRRSVKEEEGMRLEVEETGHAVTVSRAHLHRARLRRPESASAASNSHKFHVNAIDPRFYTISPETVASAVHRYLNATPQFLLSNNCSAQAQSKTRSNWDKKGYNQISHAVAGTSEIIAVVAGTEFTSFTGTKVQILMQLVHIQWTPALSSWSNGSTTKTNATHRALSSTPRKSDGVS